jgi:hypothetical protein
MSIENHGEMISRVKTPDSFTRALLESYPQSSSSKAGGTGKGTNFALRSISFILRRNLLTLRRLLRHGADGFTFPPKEDVLRIFIALKNSSLSAEFEPAILGSNCKHANH